MTIHESGADNSMRLHVAEWPEYASMLVSVGEKIRSGFFSAEYCDVFHQSHGRAGEMSMGQLHAWMMLHVGISTGTTARVQIHVGAEPGPDCDIEAMNLALADLPHTFSAKFWGGTSDYDGHLDWTGDLVGTGKTDGLIASVNLPCWGLGGNSGDQCRLEIGTTMASRTRLHLLEAGRVARWPYRSEYITILWDTTFRKVRPDGSTYWDNHIPWDDLIAGRTPKFFADAG